MLVPVNYLKPGMIKNVHREAIEAALGQFTEQFCSVCVHHDTGKEVLTRMTGHKYLLDCHAEVCPILNVLSKCKGVKDDTPSQ